MNGLHQVLHEATSHSDPKVIALMIACGVEGYGLFWILVEKMMLEETNRIDWEDLPSYSYQLHVDLDRARDIVNRCIAVKLFDQDANTFWCPGLNKRLGKFREKQKLGRINARKRWGILEDENTEEAQTSSETTGTPMGTHRLPSEVPMGDGEGRIQKGEDRSLKPEEGESEGETPKEKPKPDPKIEYFPGVTLTEKQYSRLPDKLTTRLRAAGLPESDGHVDGLLESFGTKKSSKGYRYKSDAAALDDWGIRAYVESIQRDRNLATTGAGSPVKRFETSLEVKNRLESEARANLLRRAAR